MSRMILLLISCLAVLVLACGGVMGPGDDIHDEDDASVDETSDVPEDLSDVPEDPGVDVPEDLSDVPEDPGVDVPYDPGGEEPSGGECALIVIEAESLTLTDMGLPDATWVSPVLSGPTNPLSSAYGFDLADVTGDGVLDLVRTFQADTDGWGGSTAVIEVWTR